MSSTYRTIPKFRAYEIVSRLYLPTSPDDSSGCHSLDVGHDGPVYLDAGEKNEMKDYCESNIRIPYISIEQDSFYKLGV